MGPGRLATAPLLATLLLCSTATTGAEGPEVRFNRDIRPIMSDICFQCHGPDKNARKADLRLDTPEGATADLSGYAAIVPGDVENSEMIARIFSDDEGEVMPPPKFPRKLTEGEKQLFKRWVAQGGKYEPHWAYLPPVLPGLPAVKDAAWPRNGIDRFVLAKLEAEGLAPAPEADRTTLLRRVSLDLNGLPPTPAEVDAFLADDAPEAYERAVDRLLASPRYGERMVWEWLDAARYADSNGYQFDRDRGMWPWRDWVVKALNDNMPFDRFTIEQLAGDLLPGATREQVLATAFNRNYMINGEGGRIKEENRIEYLVDQTDTVSTVWLGVTLGCARCHDHKYDPFKQREYYQLMAFFNNTPVDGDGGSGHTAPLLDLTTPEQKAKLADYDARVEAAARQVAERERPLFPRGEGEPASKSPQVVALAGGQFVGVLEKGPAQREPVTLLPLLNYFQDANPSYAAAVKQLFEAKRAREVFEEGWPRVMVMEESKPRKTFILEKGAYDRPTEEVLPGFPAVMTGGEEIKGKLNRLDLARWLVAPENPLTSRVTVNRYWQSFFGTGLVKTVENFGVQGDLPPYQDLLDWLAVEFRERGWDVKALHRLIVTSATYRQSSRVSPALLERDPRNSLLARGPRHRLASWMLRDRALAVSGLLVENVGGPPVKPYQPEGLWEEASFGLTTYRRDDGASLYRRSLYTFWRRTSGPPIFFDTAARQVCTVKATWTNTPLHALTTLNDETYTEAARALAERLLNSLAMGRDDAQRLDHAFRLVNDRPPTAEERPLLVASLGKYRTHFAAHPEAAAALLKVGASPRNEDLPAVEHAAWTTLCTLLLNLDEGLNKE